MEGLLRGRHGRAGPVRALDRGARRRPLVPLAGAGPARPGAQRRRGARPVGAGGAERPRDAHAQHAVAPEAAAGLRVVPFAARAAHVLQPGLRVGLRLRVTAVAVGVLAPGSRPRPLRRLPGAAAARALDGTQARVNPGCRRPGLPRPLPAGRAERAARPPGPVGAGDRIGQEAGGDRRRRGLPLAAAPGHRRRRGDRVAEAAGGAGRAGGARRLGLDAHPRPAISRCCSSCRGYAGCGCATGASTARG